MHFITGAPPVSASPPELSCIQIPVANDGKTWFVVRFTCYCVTRDNIFRVWMYVRNTFQSYSYPFKEWNQTNKLRNVSYFIDITHSVGYALISLDLSRVSILCGIYLFIHYPTQLLIFRFSGIPNRSYSFGNKT